MVALAASVLALPAAASAGESGVVDATAGLSRGPYLPERGLLLSAPEKLKVGTRARVAVAGVARAGDELSVFAVPRRAECADSASAQPARATSLISEILGEGDFRLEDTYRPRRRGDLSFCAYLRPGGDPTELRTSETRRVKAKRLRAAVARRAVVRALKRHGFAGRVVKAAESDCDRRRRDLFACRFEANFPGYRLRGRGKVRLSIGLSYRFKVKAQGVRFVLTDENEERRPN